MYEMSAYGFQEYMTIQFFSVVFNIFADTREQGRVPPMAAFPSVSLDSC